MRARLKHGLAGGAVVMAVLIAAPAIGAKTSDPGVQPPAGTVTRSTHAAPVPKQPPPGTVTRTTKAAPVPKQPVNRHPDLTGKPTTVVDRSDKGQKNARITKDRGKKNVPLTRDLGDR
jgi:hypothetical protein